MTALEFKKLQVGGNILTLYKGRVCKMNIINIYDAGNQKRAVILRIPNTNESILRHMYSIYLNCIIS